MKEKINKFLLLSIIAFISIGAYGQNRHEISMWGSAGISTLEYSTVFGDQVGGVGQNYGIGYTYFFSGHFGIGSGVEVASYNSKTKVNGQTSRYMTYDYLEHEEIEFRARFTNYEEKQRATTINIPLMFQYQSGGEHKFYATVGAKIAIPVREKYKTSNNSTIVTSGYYPSTEQELFDPQFAGYGTLKGNKIKGDLDFKVSYMLSAELGVKWKVKNDFTIYTGAYLDYGLNNIKKETLVKDLVQFYPESPENIEINSILKASYTQDQKTNFFVDKIELFSVGVKVKLAFGLGKTKKNKDIF